MATYSDSFSYGGSDATLATASSSAWASVDGTLYYVGASGNVRANVGGAFNIGYYNSVFANDQYSSLKVVDGTAVNATSWCGPAVRMDTSTGACYVLMYQRNGASSRIRIGYYNGSGVSTASSYYNLGAELAITSVLQLEVSGSNLTAKIDGSTVQTWSDTTLTSGKAGIGIYAWAATTDYNVDDWTGGDLSGSSVATIAAYYSNFRD